MIARQLDKLRLRLRSLFRSSSVENELARELRAHVEEETAANVAAGMTPDEARHRAMQSFGGLTAVEELCRETRRVSRIEHAIRDVRYAVRGLARQPGLLV